VRITRSAITGSDTPTVRQLAPAGLASGPDIWEVVSVHRSFDDVARTAGWLDQQTSAIETALRYYDAHKAEIDEWIRRNEEAAEAAERVALARQAAS